MEPWDDDEPEATTTMTRLRDRAGRGIAVLLAVLLVVPIGAWAIDGLDFRRQGNDVADAVPALADAVVLVTNLACDGRNGTGSGFVVDLGGQRVVLTNRHVVEGSARVSLRTLDGSRGPTVTGVRISATEDVAVLELDGDPGTPLPLAAPPSVGDAVRLVGFPGARPITTAGEVAASRGDRVLLSMPVDGGASGAPVVDGDDRVVAQVVARTRDGSGVAIPVDRVRDAALGARPAPGC